MPASFKKSALPQYAGRSRLLRRRFMVTKNLGMLLLASYLIVSGAVVLLGLSFANMGLVMAVLAVAAGVCILIGR